MTDKIVMIIPTPLGTLIEVHLCNGFYLNLTTGYVRAKHTRSLERIKNKQNKTQVNLMHTNRGRGGVWKGRTEPSKASLWYKGHLLLNAGSKNVL